jgi:hypothetical protein
MKRFRQWPQPARITAIVIVASMLLCALAYFVPGVHEAVSEVQQVKKSFHNYGDQLVQGNYERAYQMTSPEFQAAISEDAFIAQQKLLTTRHGSLIGISIWSTEVEWNEGGASASLSAHFKYERSTEYFYVIMKPYNGQWRLYGYKEKD